MPDDFGGINQTLKESELRKAKPCREYTGRGLRWEGRKLFNLAGLKFGIGGVSQK